MKIRNIRYDGKVVEEVVEVEGNDLEEMICNYNEIEELNYDIWIGGVYIKEKDGSILWDSDEIVVEYKI